MSYVALATERFEAMRRFYGEELGFPELRSWDRADGRGVVFDLRGMRLELLDADREGGRLKLGADARDRVHLVVEVDDLDAAHRGLPTGTPGPLETSWGARVCRLRDPDGVAVWFLEWTKRSGDGQERDHSA